MAENKMRRRSFFGDLIRLYLLFCKIGAFTIGGGYAMVPVLEKELIFRRRWMTQDDLPDNNRSSGRSFERPYK